MHVIIAFNLRILSAKTKSYIAPMSAFSFFIEYSDGYQMNGFGSAEVETAFFLTELFSEAAQAKTLKKTHETSICSSGLKILSISYRKYDSFR